MAFLLRRLVNIQRTRRFHIRSALFKDKEEDMDQLKENPYFSKYADKIAKLQKTSPEEFLSRLAQAEELRKPKEGPSSSQEREFSMPSKPKSSVEGLRMAKEKRLADKMKTELLADKSAEEIAQIWRQFHQDKDAVCAVIPAQTYAQMKARFEEFKTVIEVKTGRAKK